MAKAASFPSPPIAFYARGWVCYCLEYLPGFALLGVLAALARFVGRAGLDSYCALYAILLGIFVRNVAGLNSFFEVGTRTYEVFWKIGIVLLGSQMGLQNFKEVGLKGAGLAGLEVIACIGLTLWLARVFKVATPLRYLLAVGLGICGVSAVIALASALHTDEEDTSYAISVILVLGVFTLTLMPLVGRLLNLGDFHFGLWAGLSVNNTAEAIATGFTYSDAAGHYSTIAKLCRTTLLGAALLYFVQRTFPEGFSSTGPAFSSVINHFPKFAIGLLLFSGLATLHFWPQNTLAELNHLYRWAFLLGFAGIGLRTDLGRLRRRGLKPLVLACGIQCLSLLATLGSILLAF